MTAVLGFLGGSQVVPEPVDIVAPVPTDGESDAFANALQRSIDGLAAGADVQVEPAMVAAPAMPAAEITAASLVATTAAPIDTAGWVIALDASELRVDPAIVERVFVERAPTPDSMPAADTRCFVTCDVVDTGPPTPIATLDTTTPIAFRGEGAMDAKSATTPASATIAAASVATTIASPIRSAIDGAWTAVATAVIEPDPNTTAKAAPVVADDSPTAIDDVPVSGAGATLPAPAIEALPPLAATDPAGPRAAERTASPIPDDREVARPESTGPTRSAVATPWKTSGARDPHVATMPHGSLAEPSHAAASPDAPRTTGPTPVPPRSPSTTDAMPVATSTPIAIDTAENAARPTPTATPAAETTATAPTIAAAHTVTPPPDRDTTTPSTLAPRDPLTAISIATPDAITPATEAFDRPTPLAGIATAPATSAEPDAPVRVVVSRAEDLADAIEQMRPIPRGGATLEVEAPGLGAIRLHVVVEGDTVRVRIHADAQALSWFAREHDGLCSAARQAVPEAQAVDLQLHCGADSRHDKPAPQGRGYVAPEPGRDPDRARAPTTTHTEAPVRPTSKRSLVDVIA